MEIKCNCLYCPDEDDQSTCSFDELNEDGICITCIEVCYEYELFRRR